MDIESFRNFCLRLKGTEEALPFGPDTLVFKVMGKMFALTGLEKEEFQVNLKCLPEKAIELREEYPDHIFPGWHMNKQNWNTVFFERGLSQEMLQSLILDSYHLVIEGLPVYLKSQWHER